MSAQFGLFGAFLLLSGIPHGALDHLVEAETAKRSGKKFHLPRFIVKYLAAMLFYGAVWFFEPTISLLFFLVISAWHFGETDLENAPATLFGNLARFAFGSFVLSFLLLAHAPETASILARISRQNVQLLWFWDRLAENRVYWLAGNLLTASFFFEISRRGKIPAVDLGSYFRLGIILTLTYFMPLLPAFALYFGGWHSLRSFRAMHDYLLEKKPADGQVLRMNSFLRLWSKSMFFTFLSFVFLAALVYFWYVFLKSMDPLPLVFVFLSMITLPHLNIMHRMGANGGG